MKLKQDNFLINNLFTMKKSILKTVAAAFAFVLFVSVMSSCNKGIGCPGEMTVTTSIIKLF